MTAETKPVTYACPCGCGCYWLDPRGPGYASTEEAVR